MPTQNVHPVDKLYTETQPKQQIPNIEPSGANAEKTRSQMGIV